MSPAFHDLKLHNNPIGAGETWRHVRDELKGLELIKGEGVFKALVNGEPLASANGWRALNASDIKNKRKGTHDRAAEWVRTHVQQGTDEEMQQVRDCVTTMLQFLEPSV